MAVKPGYFLVVFLGCSLSIFCQELSTLSGHIVDIQTRNPIPSVQLFLANTTKISVAKEDGSYLIEKISSGKYDLVILVNNEMYSYPVDVSGPSVEFDIEVKQEAITPKKNDTATDSTVFKKYFPVFRNYLLGNSTNNQSCIIVNPKDIHLEFNKNKRILTVGTSKLIEILNQALGYRIFLRLEEFEVDFKKNNFRFFGVPTFQELLPSNKAELNRYENKRELAYYGSLQHFLRSLLSHQLGENFFSIYKFSSDHKEHQVTEDSLFTGVEPNQINLKGDLKIIFNGQVKDRMYRQAANGIYGRSFGARSSYFSSFLGSYYFRPSARNNYYRYAWPNNTPFQMSFITLNDPSIYLYKNGYFEDYKSIILDGYLAYRECLSNALPYGFTPTRPLVRLQ